MKHVTIYHNSINTIPMRKWTAAEQDFFFAVLTQIKDEGRKEITFDSYQLKEFANYTNEHKGRFRDTMNQLAEKMMNLQYIEETTHSYTRMILFQYFHAEWSEDLSNMSLTVQISDKFEYIVNQLHANFTQFELEIFTNLRSTYSKTAFRHFKQWRTKGIIGGFPDGEISKEDFFTMLGVPKSMQRADNFNSKVIKPILEELSPYFEGLKIKPIKARKAGNPIIAYRPSWKQEITGKWIDGKFEVNKPKKVTKGVPEWSNQDYKNTTTSEQKEQMARYQVLAKKERTKEMTLAELEEFEVIKKALQIK